MEKLLGNLPPWLQAYIPAWCNQARCGWLAALLLFAYATGGAISQEAAPPVPALAVSSVLDIQTARQAYWQGRLDEAERLYQTLARQYPDNPDLVGELGNVYWQQGKQEAAFAVYFEAASRLYRQQQQQKAWDLLTFLNLSQWLRQNQASDLFCQLPTSNKQDN